MKSLKSVLVVAFACAMLFAFTACEQKMPEFPSEGTVQAAIIASGDTTYLMGDSFDPSRYEVTIRFSDGKTETVPGASILTVDNDFATKAGSYGVTVNYGGTETAINDVYVTVFAPSAVEIALDVDSYKYADYAALKSTAVTGTAVVTYGNGVTREISNLKVTADAEAVTESPEYGETAEGSLSVAVYNGNTWLVAEDVEVTVTSDITTDPSAPSTEYDGTAVALQSVSQKTGKDGIIYIDDPTSAVTTAKFDFEAVDANGNIGDLEAGSLSKVKVLVTTADNKPVDPTSPFAKGGSFILNAYLDGTTKVVKTPITVSDYLKTVTLSAAEGYAPENSTVIDKSEFTLSGEMASGDKVTINSDEFDLDVVFVTGTSSVQVKATYTGDTYLTKTAVESAEISVTLGPTT